MNKLVSRLGRGLLGVLPRGFRDRYGEEVAEFFARRTHEVWTRQGWLGVARFWFWGAIDVIRTAAAERKEERAMLRPSGGRGALTDLTLDIRFAFRALRRSPVFTAVGLATLALGIGASTAMFSVMNATLGRALPFPEPDRLVMGRGTWGGNVNPLATFLDFMDYRDQAESLESLAAIGGGAGLATITGTGEPQQARVTDVTGNLFETLRVAPMLGGTFTIEEQPEAGGGQVVISHGFWERWFGGDPDVVGRSVSVDGDLLMVMGVMPAGFRILYDVDLWTPPWPGNSDPINRRYTNWLMVGRLANGVSLEAARSEIDVISRQLQQAYPETNGERALQIDPLHSVMVEEARPGLWILTGAIVLVLLIACGNVASLLMARGSARAPELAVRAALGAGPTRLTRQLMVECTVLSLAGGTLGVMMATWLQEVILGFVSPEFLGIREVGVSLTMLGIGLGVSLATALLFGVFPSLATARANPAANLKEGSRGSASGSGIRYRSGLVILQVALSLTLLTGAGLLLRSFAKLRGVDPGFRVESLLTASVSLPSDDYLDGESKLQFFQSLQERVEALPGVERVALISRLPVLQIWGNYHFWAPGRPPEGQARTADRRVVFPGYFETMEIPLVEGRALEESDVAGSAPVIVLGRTAAQIVYPDASALGRPVVVDMGSLGVATYEVVGIVEDHKHTSLSHLTPRPAMFFPYAQIPLNTMRLAVSTKVEPTSLIRPIQERVWELDPDIVLSDAQTMADALSDSIAGSRSIATVLSMFAVVAVGLAALGLYGVLAFFVTQRTRDIGIRIALGASGGRVLGLVVSRGMLLVGIGSVLGIAGAVGATRLLQGMLFGISATDPTTFAGVTVLFVLVALGACVVPAGRALGVDPVEALRTE
jgi:putative ABC transport system permease protein